MARNEEITEPWFFTHPGAGAYEMADTVYVSGEVH
jgi:hypothetical protein